MSGLNRRTFLAGATAATLAAATRGVAQSVDANSTVAVAIMGVNNRGSQLATSLVKLPGVRIAYVCDCDERSLPKGIAAATSAGGPRPQAIEDFRQALDDKSVDALFVAAPNHWHAAGTIIGLAAGKHVYCEKPCSHTADEGERMIAAARDAKKVVQVGLQRRSNPHWVEAVERIRSGAIGRLLYANSTYNNNRPSLGRGKEVPPPAALDYDLWQGPVTAQPYRDNIIPYNWHQFWHWGNGELGNNGVHTIDFCRWALGVDFPKRVVASGTKLRYDDDQETPDTYNVFWDFDGRGMSWEAVSWSPAYVENGGIGVSLRGENGTLYIDDSGYKIYDLKRKVVAEQSGHRSEAEHLANFLDAIRNDAKVNCSVEEGHRSTMLCHLGNMAMRTGQTIEVDPTTGHIKDNPAAQALWSCEYRPGWFPTN
ncbi:MAG: Gfo/Idh/MocA family oxidoreductase [Pirellulales bacterium]